MTAGLFPAGPDLAAEPDARDRPITLSASAVRLPGRLISYTVMVRPGTQSGIVLLLDSPEGGDLPAATQPGEDPSPAPEAESPGVPHTDQGKGQVGRRSLWSVRVSDHGPGVPVLLKDHLPAATRAVLAMALNSDGRDELLLQEGEKLMFLPMGEGGRLTAPPRILFTDADLNLRVEEPHHVEFPADPAPLRSPLTSDKGIAVRLKSHGPPVVKWPGSFPSPHLRVTGLGALRFYAPDAPGGPWHQAASIRLPVRAGITSSQMLLTSPQVRTLGRSASGTLLLAAGPVPYGAQRLRTVLVEVSRLDAPQAQDVWSRLPRGEAVENSVYLTLDGAPYLLVLSRQDDENVQFFGGDHRMYLFSLAGGRNRAGVRPILNLGKVKDGQRAARITATDANGDGLDDLILMYRDKQIIVSTYLQKRKGGFSSSPRKTKLAKGNRPLRYGMDLDGDGKPDLLASTDNGFLIYSGAEGTGETDLVGKQPRWAVRAAVGTDSKGRKISCQSFSMADIDDDGRHEILCPAAIPRGPSVFGIFHFHRLPIQS